MNSDDSGEEPVRRATPSSRNIIIDKQILDNIRSYGFSDDEAIQKRLRQLDKEWDIERVLELNMSAFAICGMTMSLFVNRYAVILPIILLLFFIWHAVQGWCPPIPILRRFKVRTRSEIDSEKFALKALRGDFAGIEKEQNADRAFEAVKRS